MTKNQFLFFVSVVFIVFFIGLVALIKTGSSYEKEYEAKQEQRKETLKDVSDEDKCKYISKYLNKTFYFGKENKDCIAPDGTTINLKSYDYEAMVINQIKLDKINSNLENKTGSGNYKILKP